MPLDDAEMQKVLGEKTVNEAMGLPSEGEVRADGTKEEMAALAAAMDKPDPAIIAKLKERDDQAKALAEVPSQQIQALIEAQAQQAEALARVQAELEQEMQKTALLEKGLATTPRRGVGHPIVADIAPDGQAHYKLPQNLSDEDKWRLQTFDGGGLLG